MASLLIVTGPPGAGKTTVAGLLAHRFDPSAVVAGDLFYDFLVRGAIRPWQSEARHQNEVLTGAAGLAAGHMVRGGISVVFDGMVGPWFLRAFASATRLDEIDYVILQPPADVCVQRVTTRVGHGFNDVAATRHMHREFARATIDDRHVVDARADPHQVVDEITRRMVAGALRIAPDTMADVIAPGER